jgi:hypothetical protein
MQPEQHMKGLQPSVQPLPFVSFLDELLQDLFFMRQHELSLAFFSQAFAILGVSMHCVERKSTIAANMEVVNFTVTKINKTGHVYATGQHMHNKN